jgi:hypothetical protein
MNLGKRIEQRLKDLNWDRKDLLEKVTELTPQALSNLIRRDSRRSEWDEAIAAALGVNVLWLVYGHQPTYTVTQDKEIPLQNNPIRVEQSVQSSYGWPFQKVEARRYFALPAQDQETVQDMMMAAIIHCEQRRGNDTPQNKRSA